MVSGVKIHQEEMDTLRIPPTMNFKHGNIAKNWSTWFQQFEIFILASGKSDAEESVKIATFLNLIGEVFERYKFLQCNQKEDQTMSQYITELKSLAASCEYQEQENIIRDRIVMGLLDQDLREKLFQVERLTLAKTEDICRVYEQNKKQVQEMNDKPSTSVDVVRSRRNDKISYTSNKLSKKNYKNNYNYNKCERKKCHKCDSIHDFGKCPAFGKLCSLCKKKNHFASCCFKKRNNHKNVNDSMKNVNDIDIQYFSDSDDEFFIDNVDLLYNCENAKQIDELGNNLRKFELLEDIIINGKLVYFKIDTGAECNVLPVEALETVDPVAKIMPQNVILTAYNGTKLQVKGSTELDCVIRGKIHRLKFYVVKNGGKPILGLRSILNLNLLKVIDSVSQESNFLSQGEVIFTSKEIVLQKYSEVFGGLGCFPGKPYRFVLKDDCKPCVFPARRIPKRLLPEFEKCLNKLEEEGVICKQIEPTDWVNNIVVTEKSDKSLRICLDPTVLNEYIKREHFQIPSPNELLADLNNKKIFSILDLKDSFYQIKLDKFSSELTTFATHLGRYRFLRLPFGINTAAEVFQRQNTLVFGDILGNKIYIDDLIISGSTEQEHDVVLKKVLDRAKKLGITFNKNKFQFKKREIKVLGFKVSEKGIEIDSDRIETIIKLENPRNKKELLRFLGLVKYLGKFIPNLSQITAPLRQLTCNDAIWKWEKIHSERVECIKKFLTSPPCLVHYDDKSPLTVQCDASIEGMGACLLQKGQPIAFASRALTDCEKRYACIEREMGAILFAADHFSYYIYGHDNVLVQTDHKPLVNIFRKDLNKLSSRLQRMRLKLLKYNFEVSYLPGKKMFIADMLSRAPLKYSSQVEIENSHIISSISKFIPMSKEKISELKKEFERDEILTLIRKYISTAWPKNLKKLPDSIKKFFQIKHELSIDNDLIFYGDRIIIPKSLRYQILQKLHEGHLGINKCRNRANESVYWPNISRDIVDYVNNCHICLKFKNNNPRLPMLSHDIPERPWQRIGADICEYKGKTFLAIMDYYSKWIELRSMRFKTAQEVSRVLMKVFSCHGFPDYLVADNQPFNSVHLKEFLGEYNTTLITSSPNYPRGNGLAEKCVNICKNMLKKCQAEGGNLDFYLLKYRNTPISGIGLSPAQILFNRRLKDNLPTVDTLLEPKLIKKQELHNTLKLRQQNQKFFYDKHTQNLPEGKVGSKVMFKLNDKWENGIISKNCDEPRSLIIKDESGKLYRRNRQHLTVKKETPTREPYFLRSSVHDTCN
ncbi:uncharacterized protein K02A2.6-like isoform X2 [Coccinella septempunctata]|uniref:uncharacterized protein K02A2.6-like isoform X2 n=1 Tax=Coccinella septempunctata TaxID=41139 RepID=UPI001D0898F4|nr:uncharacterized protein K02A2.6-like isoform X2 [Coccinella septempunctata]